MKAYQIGTVAVLLGGLVFGFQNCAKQGSLASTNQTSADAVAMRKTMADLKTQILSLSAKNLSCATDADCAMVPVGAIHCGAPTFNVLSSTSGSTFPDVLDLAKEYGDIEKNYAASNQIVGTCEVPTVPTARCVQNLCTTN